jgi:hypothetical protein
VWTRWLAPESRRSLGRREPATAGLAEAVIATAIVGAEAVVVDRAAEAVTAEAMVVAMAAAVAEADVKSVPSTQLSVGPQRCGPFIWVAMV